MVNLEPEVRHQREWSPGTQLPGRPWCEGQEEVGTTSGNDFQGLKDVGLGKEKRDKMVGGITNG